MTHGWRCGRPTLPMAAITSRPGRRGCASARRASRWPTAATARCTRRSGHGRSTSSTTRAALAGMSCLNLKSMFNDPSQQREALAWRLFGSAGVPAARHTYAKLAFDQRYYGPVLVDRAGRQALPEGATSARTTRATCTRPTAATSAARRSSTGSEPTATTAGASTAAPADSADATYRLKTNEDDPAANSYDDLAEFVRSDQRDRPARRARPLRHRRVPRLGGGHLRRARVPALGGRQPADRELGQLLRHPVELLPLQLRAAGRRAWLHGLPVLHVHPVGLRQQLGIDYFGTEWQYTDMLDWPANTRAYRRGRGFDESRW